MPWKKGQSGNPNGRPRKERALTEVLESQGRRTLEDADGKRRAGKRVLARLLWEGITTGVITFPEGRILALGSVDWKDLVKFIYQHIDGPPRAELDVTSGGEPVKGGVNINLSELTDDQLATLISIAESLGAEDGEGET